MVEMKPQKSAREILTGFYTKDLKTHISGVPTYDSMLEKALTELEEAVNHIIGENETGTITDPDSTQYGEPYENTYVDRDEQRKRLKQWLKGSDE